VADETKLVAQLVIEPITAAMMRVTTRVRAK